MKGLTKAGLRIVLLGFAVVCLACEFPGRMTGGGSVFVGSSYMEVKISGSTDDMRVTHGFEIHCGDPGNVPGPNNLEINWPGYRFHLEELLQGRCYYDPEINPRPPAAGFNTFVGMGIGKLNGVDGASIEFTFTDAGEPGTKDKEAVAILPPGGGEPVLEFGPTFLTFGNHQAHKDNR